MNITARQIWAGFSEEERAMIAAGKHKQYEGLHQLRIDILVAEAERRALWNSFSDT